MSFDWNKLFIIHVDACQRAPYADKGNITIMQMAFDS